MAVKKSAQGTKATKLVRKPNDINLKANGAGYATKDKSGNVTYYKNAGDAAGYNDTTQSRANMSKGNAMFTKDAQGKVITSESLAPREKINLPTPPAVNPLTGVLDTANASLAGSYDPKTKQMTPAPVEQTLFQQLQGAQADAFSEFQGKSQENLLREQERMLRPKEKAVNSLTAQLNTITANRDAEMLALEGQGRGVTESIIGGQQAQISREAAIQAMPIQAQLAVAQADLDSARSYASQLFQAQSQDALAKYNYQKELNSSIYNFLDSQEKARLAKTEKEQDRKFQVEQANRSTLKQLAMQAIDNGQSALAAEIMRGNPASETFDADFGDYVSRLRKPVAAGDGAPKVVSINGVDSVWNPTTKQFEPIKIGGNSPGTTLNGKPQTDAERTAQLYADRMLQANAVITEIGDKFAKPESLLGQYVPNIFKDAERQKFEQAQRNFINAVLRKESGAVIAQDEFDNARLQYFPQPGDSAGVLLQKAQNRNTAINGIYNAANVQSPTSSSSNTPLTSGYKGVTTSGLTFTIE